MLNFLGIGAQKAGTTWLFEMLSKHPEIAFPGGKEMHFWNSDDFQTRLSSYSHTFDGDEKIKGEITPAYSMLDPERISIIREYYPDLKMIFIMRNPMSRAWASALMALRRAEMQRDEASDQWFIDHFRSRGSLARGDYLSCLKNWRSSYPEDRLLLLRYEDLCGEPRLFLEKCVQYLGLNPEPVNDISDETLQTRVFSGSGHPIPASLMAELNSIYEPMIKNLSTFVGNDVLKWLPASK